MKTVRAVSWCLAAAVVGVLAASPASARDAAFVAPSLSGVSDDANAIKVEPKSEIDTGESILNVSRHTTLFFVNQTSMPVQVEKVTLNADSNVVAEIAGDDCSKQGTIVPGSRCTVEVSVKPSAPGSWSVEALLTHNGMGRITRAKLTGKATGTAANAGKEETGLALNSKQAPPINFDDVDIGSKTVRSALMVNDSSTPITLYSIDVIEAGNGLERLEQGCAVDMELKPGESCPVTLLWRPESNGIISTDLIIRHSGRLGFAVVPIRGNAGSGKTAAVGEKTGTGQPGGKAMPSPPTAQELDRAMSGKIPPVAAGMLPAGLPAPPLSGGIMRLIGTVGNQAILLLPDGTTTVVAAGDEINLGDKTAKVASVGPSAVEILADGKKSKLTLQSAPELTARAAAATQKDQKEKASSANNLQPQQASGSQPTPALGTGSAGAP